MERWAAAMTTVGNKTRSWNPHGTDNRSRRPCSQSVRGIRCIVAFVAATHTARSAHPQDHQWNYRWIRMIDWTAWWPRRTTTIAVETRSVEDVPSLAVFVVVFDIATQRASDLRRGIVQ